MFPEELWPLHLLEMVSTPFCQIGGGGHRNVSLASQIEALKEKNLPQEHQGSHSYLK